jgi:hypothetical protein
MHVKGHAMYAANAYDIREATEADAPGLRRLAPLDRPRPLGPRARRVNAHRICRATIAGALVWVLVVPATSSAQDGRAAAPTSSLAGTTSTRSQDLRAGAKTSSLAGTTSAPSQDLRAGAKTSSLAGTTSAPSQDLRVAATTSSLAGTTSSRSQDLRAAAPTSSLAGTTFAQSGDRRSLSGGINWRDAGTVLGMIVLALAGATAVMYRRRRGPRTASPA